MGGFFVDILLSAGYLSGIFSTVSSPSSRVLGDLFYFLVNVAEQSFRDFDFGKVGNSAQMQPEALSTFAV